MAPLQLQLGQVAFEPGSGEESGVDPAQGQIDDEGEIGVVATLPCAGSCSFGNGNVGRKLSARVNAGPALASDSSTGPRSLSS